MPFVEPIAAGIDGYLDKGLKVIAGSAICSINKFNGILFV